MFEQKAAVQFWWHRGRVNVKSKWMELVNINGASGIDNLGQALSEL